MKLGKVIALFVSIFCLGSSLLAEEQAYPDPFGGPMPPPQNPAFEQAPPPTQFIPPPSTAPKKKRYLKVRERKIKRQPAEKILPVKKEEKPKKENKETKTIRVKKVKPKEEFESEHPASFSILAHTPLINENNFDKRFTSVGANLTLSVKLVSLADEVALHGEFGAGFTYSRLELIQPSITFGHTYIIAPFRLRLVFLNPTSKIDFEAIAGLQMKLFEIDSRTTTDGGFNSVDNFFENLDPEFGLGLRYRLGQSTRLRIIASYLFASLGIELDL